MKSVLVSLVFSLLGASIVLGDDILPPPKTEAAKPADRHSVKVHLAVPGPDMQHHCWVAPVHPFGNNLVAHEIGDAPRRRPCVWPARCG